MKIKPTYKKSYVIRYKRKNDVQSTEVVDTTGDDVLSLISDVFDGRFARPVTRSKEALLTQVSVVELDNVRKQSNRLLFAYYSSGKVVARVPFALVRNLSPREARIAIEKAIKNQ